MSKRKVYTKDFTLSAGDNKIDVMVDWISRDAEGRIIAVDMVLTSGTKTGLVNATLFDHAKTYGVQLLPSTPLYRGVADRGVAQYLVQPMRIQWGDWIRFRVQNATADDVVRCTLVMELD